MNKEEIKVSVLCTAYNHEKFLRKCLDGFVNQKTNFKYEVIVHDDASTDGTKTIIEEYVKKYPNIFVPIYQTENQYSKKVEIMDDIMLPLSRGKYIAICEGDDYWCDENKLQLQYDFMESHLECSACFHNNYCYDLLTGKTTTYNNWKEIHYLTPQEVFEEGLVHTTSHFVRREYFKKDKETNKYSFGDYVKKTNYFRFGKLAVLPQIMSVYNFNNSQGLTYIVHQTNDINKRCSEIELIIEYLNYYDKITNFKYNNEIKNKIENIDFRILEIRNIYEIKKCNSRKVYRGKIKEIKEHDYFKNVIRKRKGIAKIKALIKYNSPMWLFKLIIKNR